MVEFRDAGNSVVSSATTVVDPETAEEQMYNQLRRCTIHPLMHNSPTEIRVHDMAGRVYLLVAEDAAGENTQVLHRVDRDSRAPRLMNFRPSGTVKTPSVRLRGTVVDRHLSEVLVNGHPATVERAASEAAANPEEGEQVIEIVACDAAGLIHFAYEVLPDFYEAMELPQILEAPWSPSIQ